MIKRLLPLLLLFAYACSKDSGETAINQPPSAFQASVSGITTAAAHLSWTAATDPEGSAVSYTVVLGSDTLSRRQTATAYSLTGLSLQAAYTGSVIAYDNAGNSSKAGFSFMTNDHPAPSSFTITQEALGYTSSTIAWTAATLADNSAVVYDVYLNSQLVATHQASTRYLFQNLSENTAYTAKVIALSSQGKSTDKTFSFTTRENTAPSAPVVSAVYIGFTQVNLSFTPAIDPKGNQLSYQVFVDNRLRNIFANVVPNTPLVLDALSPSTTFTAYVLVTNTRGDSTKSSPVTFTTHAAPALNSFTVTGGTSNFTLKVKKGTATAFTSLDLLNNGNVVAATPVSVQTAGDEVTVTYANSVLPEGVTNRLKVRLNWSTDQGSSVTQEATYRYYNFTPNSVSVFNAYITTSPFLQFNVSFVNSIISEYNTWEVVDLAFEAIHFHNLLMPGLGAPNKTYITGNLTQAQADVLRSGSQGFVIIKDAGGCHKHTFNYTFN